MNLFAHSEQSITLSTLEFDVLWEWLGLGSRPIVLDDLPSPGKTHHERAEIVSNTLSDLDRRGLVNTAMGEWLADLLRMFDRPHLEVDARIWLDQRVNICAVVNQNANGAVAVLNNDRLVVRSTTASGLVRQMLRVLPARQAGPGYSVSLPRTVLDDAAKRATSLFDLALEFQHAGMREADSQTLVNMINGGIARGQFGVATRDQWRKRTRFAQLVSFFDTSAGRYLQTTSPAQDGKVWCTITPTDTIRLQSRIEQLISDAKAGQITH